MGEGKSAFELLEIPNNIRDSHWEEQFAKSIKSHYFTIVSDQPIIGPDQWPYLHIRLNSEPNAEHGHKILNWLNQRGIGLVIDHSANQEYPDLVLSWGAIWALTNYGQVQFESNPLSAAQFEFSWTDVKVAGDPNDQLLPQYARSIIRVFLQEQGVFQPRILCYSFDHKVFEIAFSLESLDSPPESEHQGILESLAWFFPPHYPLILLSEKNSPPFFPL